MPMPPSLESPKRDESDAIPDSTDISDSMTNPNPNESSAALIEAPVLPLIDATTLSESMANSTSPPTMFKCNYCDISGTNDYVGSSHPDHSNDCKLHEMNCTDCHDKIVPRFRQLDSVQILQTRRTRDSCMQS